MISSTVRQVKGHSVPPSLRNHNQSTDIDILGLKKSWDVFQTSLELTNTPTDEELSDEGKQRRESGLPVQTS